jgi:hypothetical protein
MDACIVLGVTFIALAYISQTSVPPAPTHKSVTIAIGNKFQQVLNANTTALRMLRIGNNNANDDSCWVFVGSGQASKDGS